MMCFSNARVRETFATASENKQFLILIDGGPGTGKTKTTNRLAEALKLLDMKTSNTGLTSRVPLQFPTDV